jgi:hypothetical protein
MTLDNRPYRRGFSVVGPVLLIGLGVILLLQQSGYITWNLWDIVSRLWPILIIAVGVDILIGHRSFWGGLAALVIVMVMLAGGLFLLGRGPVVSSAGIVEGETYNAPLPDAKSAEFTLSPDVGDLKVRMLGGTTSDLLRASFQEPRAGNVTKSNEVVDGRAMLTLDDNNPGQFIWNFGERDIIWDVAVSPEVPAILHLIMGAGKIDADLTGLKVESVDAKLGAGEILLRLPEKGDLQVDVSLGAGSVDIRIPAGMAVSIHCTTAVGNCVLPNGSGFWSQNYTSPGFDTAEARAHIQVSLAVGEVTIK